MGAEHVIFFFSSRRRHTRLQGDWSLDVCSSDLHEAEVSGDLSVLRPADAPFRATGGLKLLSGNLGRSVIKVSAVPEDRHVVEAPARVFDSQEALQQAFKPADLDRDAICMGRRQGPPA